MTEGKKSALSLLIEMPEYCSIPFKFNDIFILPTQTPT